MRIGVGESVVFGGATPVECGVTLVECAARLGVEGIEPYIGAADSPYLEWSAEEIRAFVESAEGAGLRIPSVILGHFNSDPAIVTAAGRAEAVAVVERTLALTEAVGAKVMLLCTFLVSHPDTPEKKDNLVKVVRAVEPLARRMGVTIGLENPLPADELAELVDGIGSDHVGVYYDIGNAVALGHDPAAEIRTLAGRITACHVKDSADELGMLHLGDGRVDLDACMDALCEVGYAGWLIIETLGDDEAAPHRDVERCRAALRRAGAQVGRDES